MCRKDGFLEAQVGDKERYFFFLNVTVHVSHKYDVVTCHLPSRDGETKVAQKSRPGFAGITLTE